MTQNIQPQATAQTDSTAKTAAPAPTIAVRESCNPDGIDLSHYVLMDRKAAKCPQPQRRLTGPSPARR